MTFPARRLPYEDARTQIRSGDILLCSGEYTFSKLIQKATGSVWSHVGFVLRVDAIDRLMVLESIEGHGVRTVALSEYVTNFEGTGGGYKGRIAIARHRRFAQQATPQGMKAMSQFAVDRLACPYDEEEIGRITARIVGAKLGLPPEDLVRNDEYICSEYVYECYRRLDITVRNDHRGFIAPADFANDPEVDLLFEVDVLRTSDKPAAPRRGGIDD